VNPKYIGICNNDHAQVWTENCRSKNGSRGLLVENYRPAAANLKEKPKLKNEFGPTQLNNEWIALVTRSLKKLMAQNNGQPPRRLEKSAVSTGHTH
jgi:hypothetical protein